VIEQMQEGREDWMMRSTKTVMECRSEINELKESIAAMEKESDASRLALITAENELAEMTQERDQLQQDLDDNGINALELRDLKQDLNSKSAQIRHLEELLEAKSA